LVAPRHWPALWGSIVEEDHFPVAALDDAVERVRALIARIDSAGAGRAAVTILEFGRAGGQSVR
jgi:hypothetical protein